MTLNMKNMDLYCLDDHLNNINPSFVKDMIWYMLTCVVADILASIEVLVADWTGAWRKITSFNFIPWKEI